MTHNGISYHFDCYDHFKDEITHFSEKIEILTSVGNNKSPAYHHVDFVNKTDLITL